MSSKKRQMFSEKQLFPQYMDQFLVPFMDQEQEALFKQILQDIDDGITDEDDFIISDLNSRLQKLQDDDKHKALVFINFKYSNRSFFEKGNYKLNEEEQQKQLPDGDSLKKIYYELKMTQSFSNLAQMICNKNFCEQNSIPFIISSHIQTLGKLGTKLLDLLDLMEEQNGSKYIHQFKILISLVSFIYSGLPSNEDQKILEIVIGSLLTKQISEFLYYLDTIKQKDQKLFEKFIVFIQNSQMKIQTIDEENKQFFEFQELQYLKSLLTEDLKQNKCNLDNYLESTLKIQNSQFTFNSINEQLHQFIILNIDIQQCYFRVIWYLWIQYVSQTEFMTTLLKNQQKREKINDTAKLKFIYERLQETLQKQNQGDIIYSLIIKSMILFTPYQIQEQEKSQFKEDQQIKQIDKYQNLKSFQDLLQVTEDQYQQLKSVTRPIHYHYLIAHKYDDQLFRKIILLLWQSDCEISLIKVLRVIFQLDLTLYQCAQLIFQFFNSAPQNFILTLLYLTAEKKKFNFNQVNLMIQYYKQNNSFHECQILIQFSDILTNQFYQKEDLKLVDGFRDHDWKLISQYFEINFLSNQLKNKLQHYFGQLTKKSKQSLIILKKIIENIPINDKFELLYFNVMIQSFDFDKLHQMLMGNKFAKNRLPSIRTVELTLQNVLSIFPKIENDELLQQSMIVSLQSFIKYKFYHFGLICQLKLQGYDNQFITDIIKAFFFYEQKNEIKLRQIARKIFDLSQEVYSEHFRIINYFEDSTLTPLNLRSKQFEKYYPCQMNISIEDLNFSLEQMSKQVQEQKISDWVSNTNNQDKFKNFLPLLYKIIKGGECSRDLVFLINQKKQNSYKDNFNMKSLFQIFYNNSNEELKTILLKYRSQSHPVPFIYKKQYFNKQIQDEQDLYQINDQLFYLFTKSYTIINFSLSEQNKKYGKTYLINEIFYENQSPFEINDTSQFNKNTIDIMFDFCFNGSREFTIADSHGQIPLEIYKKILPLFQIWIIQMETEKELEINFQQLQKLKPLIDQWSPQICLIVRDAKREQNQKTTTLINKIKQEKADVYLMQSLILQDLDKADINSQTENASKFILESITKVMKMKQQNNNQNFLQILKDFNQTSNQQTQIIQQQEDILNKIEEELNRLSQKPDVFFNEEAFPIRSLQRQQRQLEKEKIDQATQNYKGKQTKQTENRQESFAIPKETKVLKLFSSIFERQPYFILYLQFLERIRKYNANQTEKKQIEYERLQDILKQKKQRQEKGNTSDVHNNKQQLEEFKSKLIKINIGLEIFWREIIAIQQTNIQQKFSFEASKIVFELIEKGEPLELLEGDELKIKSSFLRKLMNNFQQKGEEKILVISILGPQSTGKSTMLNKMFGCHFWTGVGRCTKGIYLQKVKVQNREQYNNLFDQILLLDTEGLQNPNQSDPDFDKQIALFMLLVSDIVIINIKGEITKQFRELIEMCIFTLGQLHKNFNFVKQLSWCFNQNTHTNNKDPFIEQIQSCTDNLNKESNKEDNDEQTGHYEDILEINKDNVTVLGFSAQAKNWKYNKLDQLFSDCKQLVFNENFSTETQIYGQNIVTNFVKKFNKQKDFTQLQTFSNFIQHIEENWESIQKLPELLEFSDLISYQQNNLMKKKFDSLMLQVDLGFIKNIETNIIQLIKNQKQKLTNQTFNNIQKQEEENQNKQLQTIKKNVLGDLQEYKQQKQIAKKIFSKYIQQLEQFIKVKESDCKTQIFNIVKKKEREHQKQQGIDQINQFVISLYQNEDELKHYQKNPQLVLEVFQQMWNQIIMAQTDYTIKLFDEFSNNKFDQIQQSFPHCILQTQCQQKYLNFLKELNKINPQSQSAEREEIFNLFLNELEGKQFINVDKDHSIYYDQFYIDIQQKLKKKFSTQLIKIQDFYKWKVVWKHFNKDILEIYLKTKFVEDLKPIIIECQNQSKDKKFYDFMIFLNQFKVKYDQTHFQELVSFVKKKNNEKNLDHALQKLKNSFNFDSNMCLIITNREFQQQIQNFYPSLYLQLETTSIEVNSFESVEIQKQTLLVKAFIYNEEINIQPIYEKEVIFYYLKNPKQQKEYGNFIPQIPQIINDLVKKYQGWQKIYYGLYDMIKSQVFNKNIAIVEEDDEIFIFKNKSLITLMNLIQQKIEEYNSELSIYGVIFSNIGERCIYYFCILLIWRFGCYKKWQILEKHTLELKNDREEQLKKLQAEIQKDKINQSKHKAMKIVQLFKKYQQNKILQQCKSIADQIILEKKKTSKDLIRFLDQTILMQNFEKEQNDSQRKNIIVYIFNQMQNFEKEQNDSQRKNIIVYIFNQRQFILEYVEKEIQQICDYIMEKIKDQNQMQFTPYYLKQIINLEGNTNLFLNKIEGEEQYIKNYFKDILQQKEDLFFEQQLYSQVISCLFYAEQINKDQIKYEYREPFYEKFTPIDFDKKEFEKLQISDKEIQQLKCFLNMMIQELYQIKEEINEFKIDLNVLGVMVKINELKLEMIGCEYSCPLCNRKCDLSNDRHEKHMCQNGHQLRGMNKILVGSVPSLYTCSEIKFTNKVNDPEANIINSAEIQLKKYPNWWFHHPDFKIQNFNTLKFIQIWNNGIGKLLCNEMQGNLNECVFFKKKEFKKCENEKIHYIFLLDTSDQMGQEWKKVEKDVKEWLKNRKKTKIQVSVITFADEATIQYDKKDSNDAVTYFSYIWWCSGKADLNKAFKTLSDQIIKYQQDNFVKTIIFLYTAGEMLYPNEGVDSLKNIDEEIRSTITLMACTWAQNSAVLSQVVDCVQPYIQEAQLLQSLKGDQINDKLSNWEQMQKSNHCIC